MVGDLGNCRAKASCVLSGEVNGDGEDVAYCIEACSARNSSARCFRSVTSFPRLRPPWR